MFFPRIVFGELQLSVAVTVPTVVLAAVVLSSLPESIREADAVGAFANVVPTSAVAEIPKGDRGRIGMTGGCLCGHHRCPRQHTQAQRYAQ